MTVTAYFEPGCTLACLGLEGLAGHGWGLETVRPCIIPVTTAPLALRRVLFGAPHLPRPGLESSLRCSP